MKGFDPAMLGAETMKKTPSRVDDALASKGRGNDTLIAHLSPREAAVLKALGGSGSINPKTGLLEFWDDGGNDPGGVGGEAGSGAAGGPDSDGGNGSGYGPGVDAYGANEGVGVDGLAAGLSEDTAGYGNEDSVDPSTPGGITGAVNAATSVSEEDTPGAFQGIMDTITPGFALSAVNKAYDDFMEAHPSVKDVLYGGVLGGAMGAVGNFFLGGIKRGAKGFDDLSPEEKAGVFSSLSNGTGSPDGNSGGFSPDMIGEAAANETAPTATPASSGRIVTKPAYRFNRQMVGISSNNIYPERV